MSNQKILDTRLPFERRLKVVETEGKIGECLFPPLTRAADRHWQDATCSVLSSRDIPDHSGVSRHFTMVGVELG